MYQILKFDEMGSGHHVQFLPTLEEAQLIVESLHESWPGKYLIVDQATRMTMEITGDCAGHRSRLK